MSKKCLNVKQKTRKISVTRANGKQESFVIKNTNALLGKNNVVGMKTGLTNAAGQCLITVVAKQALVVEINGEKRLRPRNMVVVLLGSNDRFNKTLQLLKEGWQKFDQWGRTNYQTGNPNSFLRLPTLEPKAPTPQTPKQPAQPGLAPQAPAPNSGNSRQF